MRQNEAVELRLAITWLRTSPDKWDAAFEILRRLSGMCALPPFPARDTLETSKWNEAVETCAGVADRYAEEAELAEQDGKIRSFERAAKSIRGYAKEEGA